MYASYKLRTYVMAYPYDKVDDINEVHEDKEHSKFQRKMMKLSLEQIKMRNKAIEKSKENPEQVAQNIKKHEE